MATSINRSTEEAMTISTSTSQQSPATADATKAMAPRAAGTTTCGAKSTADTPTRVIVLARAAAVPEATPWRITHLCVASVPGTGLANGVPSWWSPPCPQAGETPHEIPLSRRFRILWCHGIAATICAGCDAHFGGGASAPSQHTPGYRFERTAEGRVIVSRTGGDSGRRSGEVFAQLHLWNGYAGLGIAFDSSTGFNLPDGSRRSPDASWVVRERWESLGRSERRGFPPLCPDAAFEVRSDSDSLEDLRAKMRDYLGSGARLALLVDPEARALEVYRPGQAPERQQGDTQVGGVQPLSPQQCPHLVRLPVIGLLQDPCLVPRREPPRVHRPPELRMRADLRTPSPRPPVSRNRQASPLARNPLRIRGHGPPRHPVSGPNTEHLFARPHPLPAADTIGSLSRVSAYCGR